MAQDISIREAYELRDHYDEAAEGSWGLVKIEKYACAGSAILVLAGSSMNLAGFKKAGKALFFAGALSSVVSEVSLRRSTRKAQEFGNKAESIHAHIQKLEADAASVSATS